MAQIKKGATATGIMSRRVAPTTTHPKRRIRVYGVIPNKAATLAPIRTDHEALPNIPCAGVITVPLTLEQVNGISDTMRKRRAARNKANPNGLGARKFVTV